LLFLIISSINVSINNLDILHTCSSYIIFPRILYIIQITGLALKPWCINSILSLQTSEQNVTKTYITNKFPEHRN
jgi:hypothetical protein